ncbi:MAG: nuclear export factor [Acidimicrobiia bacterium]|nr:nuclear export factor [Acidimicrobiia bacterium]
MRLARFTAAGVVAMAMTVGWVGVASAHVTVNPDTAAPGGYAKLTFRVPNEETGTNTTKVEVQVPAEAGLKSVSVQPHAGWTYAVTKQGDAVSTVAWSGGVIKPGEFEEFSLSVGPLPTDKDQLVFKALQTYDNGDVVSWIQTAAAGAAEPEHPAPVLKLVAAPGAAASTVVKVDSSSKGLAVAALVVGVVGVVLGAAALLLNRKRAQT